MELVLYGWLIKVSLVLSEFLKSFDSIGTHTHEYKIIKQGRKIFELVLINIVVLMITDSVFSAVSPFLWLGDVYSESKGLVQTYSLSSTIFYLANTVFASLVLYLCYNFDFDSAEEGP